MKDIQSERDHRRINIKKVGVKNISYPVTVRDKSKKLQKTIATVNMYVNLPHQFKGTHMSRFIEILNQFHGDINMKSFHRILEEMKRKLQAQEAHMEIEFPYFLKKHTKEGSSIGVGEYLCKMHGSLTKKDDLILTVQVPISSPTPSQIVNGMPRSLGHWGVATISLRFKQFFWMEDIIQMVEDVTSHQLPWTKQDNHEDNRLTVEALAKALGRKLSTHLDIRWFSLTVENLSEGFNTFASLEWPEYGNNGAMTH